MKKIITMLCITFSIYIQATDIVLDAATAAPVKIYGGMLENTPEIQQLMQFLKKDIEQSAQFTMDIVSCALPKYTKEIDELFNSGYPLLFYVNKSLKNSQIVEWRLYDATQKEMIMGKKQDLVESTAYNAHCMSDSFWQELIGERGPFLTRIAYIKRTKGRNGKKASSLCSSDWLGQDEHVLLNSSRILVAPSFYTGIDSKNPQLFFSEFTPSNVRCMRLTHAGEKMPIFDLEGTCVGISCVPDGNTAVYCRSGDLWRYTYDVLTKKGLHERIIHKDNPCTHPTLLTTGSVIFGSGGALYSWNADTKKIETLVADGYCVAPDMHEKSEKIVYSKRIKGIMQLVVTDIKSGTSEQLTTDSSDKIDPRWSPCGKYVVFCQETGKESRIGIIHIHSKRSVLITPAGEHCSYPAWSWYGVTW